MGVKGGSKIVDSQMTNNIKSSVINKELILIETKETQTYTKMYSVATKNTVQKEDFCFC